MGHVMVFLHSYSLYINLEMSEVEFEFEKNIHKIIPLDKYTYFQEFTTTDTNA